MIELTLPWPDKALFPNRRLGRSWQASYRAKREAREAAYLATRAAQQARPDLDGTGAYGGDGPVAVRYVCHPPDKRRRDVDGILSALKHAQDGIAEALVVDDAWFNPVTIERGEPVSGGKVVVRIG